MASRGYLWRWIAGAALAAVLLVVGLVLSLVPLSSDRLRDKVMQTLSASLESDVSIASLQLRLFPLRVSGTGLEVRHHGRRDVPPLVSARSFAVEMNAVDLLRRHVARVAIDGLDIEIPPHHGDDKSRPAPDDSVPDVPKATSGEAPPRAEAPDDAERSPATRFVIDDLVSNDARLVILPDNPSPPKVWAIHQLEMSGVALSRSMPFKAALTNAVPPGEIATSGHFGPWQAGDPGQTPLDGLFTFDHADLSVFKGISGILSAQGGYSGSLGRIDVHGQTDTPEFTVAVGGHPVPLKTTYHAIIDGTNGDTILERIDGTFLGTSLVARGAVVDTPGADGRTVRLQILIDHGQLQDILKLAVNTKRPPMTGALKLTTAFLLPPGKTDVVDRLHLDGRFSMARVRFSSFDVQKKIDELSRRSRGRPDATDSASVASNFDGTFSLGGGSLKLAPLSFSVPGASVRLAGRYGLRPGTMDFTGTLDMDAKISQTTKGVKRLLLKIVDPLFSKDGGGSQIPIKISGQRTDPQFGLDKSRIFRRKK